MQIDKDVLTILNATSESLENITDLLTDGAKRAYKKYRRFEPDGQGFYTSAFFNMGTVEQEIKNYLPSTLTTDIVLYDTSYYANEFIFRYGINNETEACIKVICYANTRKSAVKYNVIAMYKPVTPIKIDVDFEILSDKFGTDLESMLSAAIKTLQDKYANLELEANESKIVL